MSSPACSTQSRWCECGAALLSVALWVGCLALVLLSPAPGLADVSVPAEAYGEGAVEGGDPRVEARLIVDVAQVAPGESFRAGVLFSIDPSWHIYWRNPGDAGMATVVAWRSPQARFGELLWPAPEPYSQADGFIVTVGYSDQVTLFVEAQASSSPGEQVTLEAEVDFLACKVDCIPGSVTLRRSVPVGARRAAAGEVVELLDAASASTPKTPGALGLKAEVSLSQTPVRPGDSFEAALALRCAQGRSEVCPLFEVDASVPSWAFIPDLTPGLTWKTQSVKALSGERAAVALRVSGKASADVVDGPGRFAGLVRLKTRGGVRVVRVEAAVPRAARGAQITETTDAPLWRVFGDAAGGGQAQASSKGGVAAAVRAAAGVKPEAGESSSMSLWQALLFGFLGGMLLNLMPCVLPVLAIKVVAFVRMAREDRAEVMRHGVAYTVGVCGSMLALACVVLALKAAGTQVGWGFQFQEPVFVAALACVLVLFALNLFGVFEIGVGSGGLEKMADGAHSLRRSAAEGVLAVVLATPCSAPLMGSAVGFALASSPWVVLAVFLSLGLGLALPFVALTLAPGLIERLPRPGPWMMHLKHGLGFVLLGTTIWLLWIVGKLQGVDGLTGLLVLLLGLATAVWLMSAGGRAAMPWLWRGAALVVLGSSALLGSRFGGLERGAAQEVVAAEGEGDWRPYSEAAVAQALAQGRPVFVNFTADWCITCKVNEGTVLTREGVLDAARRHRVVMFKGDWTRRDELIRGILARHGKAGVPMYLMYSPAAPESPQVLPELLTEALLVEAMAASAAR